MKAYRSPRWARLALLGTAGLFALAAPRSARAQGAVAFQPVISTFPDGVMLNATPVVSADRRYVRFTNIQPQFTTLQEFNVFVIPAAVGGGGIGGLPGGGIGGVGAGGLGAGGAGFGSVPLATPDDPLAMATVRAPAEASAVPARPAKPTKRTATKPRRRERRAPQP